MAENKYKWTLIMIIIGTLIFLLNLFLLGRVSLTPVYFSFPYSLLLISAFNVNLVIIAIILGLLQYPIYGLILDKSNKKMMSFIIILIVHLVVVLVALQYTISAFK